MQEMYFVKYEIVGKPWEGVHIHSFWTPEARDEYITNNLSNNKDIKIIKVYNKYTRV